MSAIAKTGAERELRLEVRRDRLHTARVLERRLSRLARGEALFAVERFSLSANNITYALLGERLGYWNLFPAPDKWGQIPVWGYLRAVESRSEAVPGQLAYGLCPPASHVILTPERVNDLGFVAGGSQRSALDRAYNSYAWLERDPAHDPDLADELLVLRPLFWLSFLLDDYLAEERLLEGHDVLLTSASSKAAVGTAELLARRGVRVLGLTSPGNLEFVSAIDFYTRALSYDQLAELPRSPAVLVDVAGSRELRTRVKREVGEQLVRSVVAGATHLSGAAGAPELDDEELFFFVPERMRQLARRLGWAALNRRYCDALRQFAAAAKTWLRIDARRGPAALGGAYLDVLGNRTLPDVAVVLSLSEQAQAGTAAGSAALTNA